MIKSTPNKGSFFAVSMQVFKVPFGEVYVDSNEINIEEQSEKTESEEVSEEESCEETLAFQLEKNREFVSIA